MKDSKPDFVLKLMPSTTNKEIKYLCKKHDLDFKAIVFERDRARFMDWFYNTVMDDLKDGQIAEFQAMYLLNGMEEIVDVPQYCDCCETSFDECIKHLLDELMDDGHSSNSVTAEHHHLH